MKEFFEKNKIPITLLVGAVIIAGVIYLVGSRPNLDTNKSQLPANLPSVMDSTINSVPNTDCLIKGNINASGKIYHIPGGQFYDRTVIDTSKGEKWFCSEAEAQAAGWRKSSR